MKYYLIDKHTGKALCYYTSLAKAVAIKRILVANFGAHFYIYHDEAERIAA